MIASWQECYDKPRQYIKKQRHHFANEDPCCWAYGFSNSHVWLWELDCKEGRLPKNWCFQTAILEKTLESPLDSKEIKPVVGRTDAEAEAPTLWPPDAKSWLIWKDPNAGKDWRQKEKRVIEYKMAGQHHWFNGHELGQTLGDSEGQGRLVCCKAWGHEDSDTTRWLNNKIVFLSKNCSQSKGTAYTKVTPIWKQIHVHWVSDAFSSPHPRPPSSPSAFNLSQCQGLFQCVNSLHQVAKASELQLQCQSFQLIFRVDFL